MPNQIITDRRYPSPFQQTTHYWQKTPHVPASITCPKRTGFPGQPCPVKTVSGTNVPLIFQGGRSDNLCIASNFPIQSKHETTQRIHQVDNGTGEGPSRDTNSIEAVSPQMKGTKGHFPAGKVTRTIDKETHSPSISCNSTTGPVPNNIHGDGDDHLPLPPVGSDNTIQDSAPLKFSKPQGNEIPSTSAPTSRSEALFSKQVPSGPLHSLQKIENKPCDNITTYASVGTTLGVLTSGTSPKSSSTDGSQAQSCQAEQASQVETNEKLLSLKPALSFEQSNTDVVLSWDLPDRKHESIVIKYELFVISASTETDPSTNCWNLLGVVDALALPMACTINQFQPGASYYFTVRAITENYECGLFSDPYLVKINIHE